MKSWKTIGGSTIAALTLSLCLFAPRLWLMRTYLPGTFQWDRAHTFLKQCEAPFRRDIEPAMAWRILPPLVCHAIGLRGYAPLSVPWLGVLAATGYVALVLQRRMSDGRAVFGGTLLFATTSAILVPTTWLGLNDAWVWFGLLAIAFGRTRWSFAAAALLCPWIDERFVIGLPLAWLVRSFDRNEAVFHRSALQLLWVLPYLLVRIAFAGLAPGQDASLSLLRQALAAVPVLLPMAPLGWWMALRAGWVAVGFGVWSLAWRQRWLALGVIGATLMALLSVASDISRSAAVIVPATVWGCVAFARWRPAQAPRALLLVGIANLAIPAVHVTYTKLDVINPLPIEVIRLMRIP
ncbi:MAG TPA: hypothetical protein VMD31_00995 [Opitutaceae bacterium]|nr:hypothetical protein [Opitutaceae bacterium]